MSFSPPVADTAPSSFGRMCLLAATVFVLFLAYYSYCAATFPDRFSVDSYANYRATSYLAEQRKMPIVTADDPSLYYTQLGTTRSLRPPLSYLISAAVYEITAPFVSDAKTRLRLGSALLGASVVLLSFTAVWLLTSSLSYSVLVAVLVGLLPRFVLLASSNNDDIGAILAVAAGFCAVIVLHQRRANWLSLILFAAACGLILQSKFTAWLCLPWLLLMAAPPLWRGRQTLVKVLPVMIAAWVVCGGWWPIFNMVHYGVDDPTALQHAAGIQEQRRNAPANRRGYWSRGVELKDLASNHEHFLDDTYRSTIGYLYWIKLEVNSVLYWFYGGLLLLSLVFLIMALGSSNILIPLAMLGMLGAQMGFYVHHNLLRDVQVDGRYLLPLLMPLMVMLAHGLNTRVASSRSRAGDGISRSIEQALLLATLVTCFVLYCLNFVTIWLAAGVKLSF